MQTTTTSPEVLRATLEALRAALDVPEEPQHTLRERMIDAAERHRNFEKWLAAMEDADSMVVRGMQAEILLLRAELAFERRPRGLGHRLMRAVFPPPPRGPK